MDLVPEEGFAPTPATGMEMRIDGIAIAGALACPVRCIPETHVRELRNQRRRGSRETEEEERETLSSAASVESSRRREDFLAGEVESSLEGERKARLTAVSQDVAAPFLPMSGGGGGHGSNDQSRAWWG